MRRTRIPEAVLEKPSGSLIIVADESHALLYVRESRWGLGNYPQRCALQLRLLSWNLDDVLLVVLLARLGRQDLCTFESWINAGEPPGVRTLQCLSRQAFIDLYVVTAQVERTFRARNILAGDADRLVRVVRSRRAWTAEHFQRARTRLDRLYPTPHALWWGCHEESVTR